MSSLYAGSFVETYNKDNYWSFSDHPADSHLYKGNSTVGKFFQTYQGHLPSLGYCLHDYRFHSPEEENQECTEEVWLVRDGRCPTRHLQSYPAAIIFCYIELLEKFMF